MLFKAALAVGVALWQVVFVFIGLAVLVQFGIAPILRWWRKR